MTTTQTAGTIPTETPGAPGLDLKLEVVLVPVSDVDRAKPFYERLGYAEYIVRGAGRRGAPT